MNGRLRLLCVVLACSALVPVFMAADSGAKVQRVRVAADPKTETDKFAWEVFVSINASTATEGNNNVVWETWADQDLVYGDPNHTPVWPGPAIAPLKIHRSLQHILATTPRGKTFSQLNLLNRLRTRLHSDPQTSGPAVPKGGEEVRMNKPTFDFIVGNNLWYIQGQQAAFKQSTTLSFPVESKEIKAFWKVIGESDKPRYHWQVGADGQTAFLGTSAAVSTCRNGTRVGELSPGRHSDRFHGFYELGNATWQLRVRRQRHPGSGLPEEFLLHHLSRPLRNQWIR